MQFLPSLDILQKIPLEEIPLLMPRGIQQAKVIEDYNANEDDEISLQEGREITVLDKGTVTLFVVLLHIPVGYSKCNFIF